MVCSPAFSKEGSSVYDAVSYRRSELPDPRVGAELKRLFPSARPERAAAPGDDLLESPLDPELEIDRTLRVRFARDPKLAGHEDAFDLAVSGKPPTAKVVYREAAGAFRALGALAGLAAPIPRGGAAGRVRWGSVRGRPGFRRRGVLEGFYGRPWSWKARRELVVWMARRRMNLFVLAPKDEDALRASWRRPFTAEELAEIRALREAADAVFVDLAVALSPVGARARDAVDAEAAVRKLEQLIGVGVRRLVLAFDDTDPEARHAAFAAKVTAAVWAEHPEVDFTVVPAEYWGDAAPSGYLKKIGALDPKIRLGWTGPQIISRRIAAQDADRFAGASRPLALGDNYPVQDRLVSAGRLFLGPVIGRDPALAGRVEAWLSNASPLLEASKIPLATAADFAWDPAGYEPEASWARALAEAGGREAAGELELLARECASSWLTVPDGWRPRGGLRAALATWDAGMGSAPLRALLPRLARLPEALEALPEPGLARELAPWARRLSIQARAAAAALDLLEGRVPAEAKAKALMELKGLRLRAEAEQALAADLALDRFLRSAEEKLAGGAARPSAPPAETVLAHVAGRGAGAAFEAEMMRLAGGPAALAQPSAGQRWAAEAMPWAEVLAACAKRALGAPARAAEPLAKVPGSQRVQAWVWRQRMRLRLAPLWMARRLLKDFFEASEAAWSGRKPPGPRVGTYERMLVRAWAALKPDALTSLLFRHLEAYDNGDSSGLETMFTLLSELPSRVRLGGGLAEETGPWLDKIGQYGRTGLIATNMRRRAAQKKLSKEELELWAIAQEALRSSNGLELALELKLTLDAYATWAATPAGRRPSAPDLTLPANPAEI